MAAARPATIAPQQVAMDGGYRQALGGVGVALGVVQHLLVAPPAGSLHPGSQPIHAHRLADLSHLHQPPPPLPPSPPRTSARVVTKLPSGWQYPSAASVGSSRSMLSPTSVLEMPTARPARRYDSPSSRTAATASKRTSRGSGGVPPRWP